MSTRLPHQQEAGVEPPAEYEAVYASVRESLLASLFALTRDWSIAEELAQEAFERAYARWSRLQKYDRPDLWIRRVAVNLATSRWRRVRREAALLGVLQRERPVSSDGLDAISIDLLRALRRVPRRQAEALVLHYIADLSVAATGQVMGCSPGTVKAHLYQGRRRLVEELGVYNG